MSAKQIQFLALTTWSVASSSLANFLIWRISRDRSEKHEGQVSWTYGRTDVDVSQWARRYESPFGYFGSGLRICNWCRFAVSVTIFSCLLIRPHTPSPAASTDGTRRTVNRTLLVSGTARLDVRRLLLAYDVNNRETELPLRLVRQVQTQPLGDAQWQSADDNSVKPFGALS